MRLKPFLQGLLLINSSASAFSIRPGSAFTTFSSYHKLISVLVERRMMSSETNGNAAAPASKKSDHLQFGKFRIFPSQVFYESPSDLTAAIVNLRPIVPGHVLVIPKRVCPKLSDLTNDEYDDLWRSVRTVQNALERHYNTGDFNVAVQDGKIAGQSVPHVHVHILPRQNGDFEQNDDIYDKLDDWAPTESMSAEKQIDKTALEIEDRTDRTMKMMEDESLLYRALLGTEANI